MRAFVAAGATSFPLGAGVIAYRALLTGLRRLPGNGMWFVRRALAAQLPPETRRDFGAGGYALAAEDEALASLSSLAIPRALVRLMRLVPGAELIVVPRTTHLITAMRPRVMSAVIDVAVAEAVRSAATW